MQNERTGKVTKMRRIVVREEESSPVEGSQAYLVIVIIVLVAFALILTIICLVRRCSKKNVHAYVAETVQRGERGSIKGKDFDQIADGDGQYMPRVKDSDLLGVASATSGSRQTSSQDTNRDLLSHREVSPVNMDEHTADREELRQQQLFAKTQTSLSQDTK